MSKTTKIIIALVLVAIVAGGAMLLSSKSTDNDTSNGDTATGTTVTITYDDNGFSPAEVAVSSGDSVNFVNNSSEAIEPSSNPHPIHTDNPELNAGDVEPGESKKVTLTSKGSWGYHNHYNQDKRGTVIVE